jgi:hypothetical protein
MKLVSYGPDIEKRAKDIHEKFYKEEFSFPGFGNINFPAFGLVNDSNKLITVGGVRPIAEMILLTDKETSTRARFYALQEALNFGKYLTRAKGLDQLHAFVQEDQWANQLRKYGFVDCIGKALVTDC